VHLARLLRLRKTIEPGLVIQELIPTPPCPHRGDRVPAEPRAELKWQDEMREKFGLEFTIVNSELMAQVWRTHGLPTACPASCR
jgi:hypothetical protein